MTLETRNWWLRFSGERCFYLACESVCSKLHRSRQFAAYRAPDRVDVAENEHSLRHDCKREPVVKSWSLN